MSIEITHVRMSTGGSGHEHISDLRWVEDGTSLFRENPRATLVTWIEGGVLAHTGTGSNTAAVRVVEPRSGPKYLQTVADNRYTNNLLNLPRF